MGLRKWWNGQQPQPYFKPVRHWTSNASHAALDYISANYQWLIVVAIGVAGIYVGYLALK
jgi:hypothetical protein